VAALGKSGVSVGYFDTEDAAARAYDRAAIGLLGIDACRTFLNFPAEAYVHDTVRRADFQPWLKANLCRVMLLAVPSRCLTGNREGMVPNGARLVSLFFGVQAERVCVAYYCVCQATAAAASGHAAAAAAAALAKAMTAGEYTALARAPGGFLCTL
jgi:hypothetical protein